MDNLPDTYDLIVVGTGMPECIVAAAAARLGKSVLHLDRNMYYGGLWASFNLEYLIRWIAEKQDSNSESNQRLLEANWLEQLCDSEHLVLCPRQSSNLTEVIQRTFVSESLPPSLEDQSESVDSAIQSNHQDASEQQENQNEVSDQPQDQGDDVANGCGEEQSEPQSQPTEDLPTDESNNVTEGSQANNEENQSQPKPKDLAHMWTMDELLLNRHKFNIDLSPKLLFSRGSLVELLISSNTARYADFQSVNRILTFINGRLEQVPCSRADVFSTKNVNVVEKRMLMKLLTFCSEYQNHPEEYRGFEGHPFIEFLRSRKTTANIEHYILHAIAMVDDSCLTLQGLKATQKFMESLGRFGNSPFLCTCYGSAELPQCFCRLCAVFGGIYYLGRDVDAIILDSNNQCAGVISRGKKLKCSSLVMEYSYLPKQYLPDEETKLISRAIYITDASIMHAERQQNTLLRLPPVDGVRTAITVLEFGSLSFICPQNLYVVYMACRPFAESVEDDFKSAEEELFMNLEAESKNDSERTNSKPNILWKLHFKQADSTSLDLTSKMPGGVYATSSPGLDLGYDHAVQEARDIFQRMYPGEEFLPRAPDPEDIVMEEHSNPGNEEVKNISDEVEHPTNSSDVAVEKVDEVQCIAAEQPSTTQSSHVVEQAVEAKEDNTHNT